MHLNSSCKRRLVELLEPALGAMEIHYGSYLMGALSELIALDSTLPRDKKAELNGYIGEDAVCDFVYGELSREVYESRDFNQDIPAVPLVSVPEYADTTQLAARLIGALESIPRTYRLTVRLGQKISDVLPLEHYQLSQNSSLARATSDFEAMFPPRSGNERRDRGLFRGPLLAPFGSGWNKKAIHLQVELGGYIHPWAKTAPVEQGISALKSFLAMGVALKIFRIPKGRAASAIPQRALIHQKTPGGWELVDARELPDGLSHALGDLQPNYFEDIHTTPEAITDYVSRGLIEIGKVFDTPGHNERVLLASRWLFDSRISTDELLAFVQATVALEILLGDKAVSDLVGLGELLRNRCAYLIGRSHSQRNEILENFGRIYEVRSKIVHRGHDRIGRAETELFHQLQWMVDRVIQEEIRLIGANA